MAPKSKKKRGLGKSLSDLGLTALLGNDWKNPPRQQESQQEHTSSDQDLPTPPLLSDAKEIAASDETTTFHSEGIDPPQTAASEQTNSCGGLLKMNINNLQAGRYQPRRYMNDESLQELASSIEQQGIIQPIVVRQLPRKTDSNNQTTAAKYEIVAGERRFRAAKIAQLETVPVIIQELNDRDTLAIALIENLQREDLNAMDQAISLQRMLSEFDLTHQEIAEVVGKSRATISNLLRLLNLHPEVQKLVQQGDLEMGHGRALLAISTEKQAEIAEQIIARSLTVRQTEKLLQLYQKHDNTAPEEQNDQYQESKIKLERIQKRLANTLNCKVIVQDKNSKRGSGKLTIHYQDQTQLDNMTAKLMRETEE